MSEPRRRLVRAIADAPGVHFNELGRRLDLAPGQVQHHLRRLVRDGTVVREPLYGRTHYYPPEYDPVERAWIALLQRETARDVLVTLLEEGPSPPGSIADRLELARSTLEWHLGHLVEQGLVEKRHDDRNRITLAATDPAESVRLLAEIEPSHAERLVDRFERLVDRFLAE